MAPDIQLGSQEKGPKNTGQLEPDRLDPGEAFPSLLGYGRQDWKDLGPQAGEYIESLSTGSKELGAREPQS